MATTNRILLMGKFKVLTINFMETARLPRGHRFLTLCMGWIIHSPTSSLEEGGNFKVFRAPVKPQRDGMKPLHVNDLSADA